MDTNPTVRSLKIASALVIAFGVLGAAAAMPGLSVPMLLLTDIAFWPLDGAQNLAAPETRLFIAISGGLTVGLGVAMWQLARRLYPREPELARSIMLSSMISWFVVDSIGSTLAGAPFNVLLNAGFLLMFIVPLWSARSGAPSAAR
jgi:hypothetical protein